MELTQNRSISEDDSDFNHSLIRSPYELATFICSVFMLAFCVVGIIGNCLSVLIFTRPIMRSSINVLLTGLSVIDCVMLLMTIVVFVVPNFQIYAPFAAFISDSYLETIVFGPYQLGMVAQTCSVWIFLLISVERFLAVCHPLTVSRVLSVKKARVAVVCIIIAALLYNGVRILEYRKYTSEDGEIGYGKWLRGDHTYVYSYYIILYLITHFFTPFFVITTLNILIWVAIRRSHKWRSNMGRYKSRYDTLYGLQQNRRNAEKAVRTTQMIFVVTVMFALCNILTFALNVWEAISPNIFDDPDSNLRQIAYLVVDISNTLVAFNSASSFLLYAVYCKKYRAFLVWYCLAPMPVFRAKSERPHEEARFQKLSYRETCCKTSSLDTTPFKTGT